MLDFLAECEMHIDYVFIVASLRVPPIISATLREVSLVHVHFAHHTSSLIWSEMFHGTVA